jgi:hypothetical protein
MGLGLSACRGVPDSLSFKDYLISQMIIFVYNLLGAGPRVPVLLKAQYKPKVPIQKYTKVVKKFRRKIPADPLGLGPYK